ncbi:SEC-C metal-binding domain-containing protein [Paraburkholderia sp. MM5477-R1]|uniref:SEC-C metal-binding domain-containing protein n=1 Tax=Paraburkholderia sp. MM5477-R1 TaxID=2991062 RepID=UPI003D21D709
MRRHHESENNRTVTRRWPVQAGWNRLILDLGAYVSDAAMLVPERAGASDARGARIARSARRARPAGMDGRRTDTISRWPGHAPIWSSLIWISTLHKFCSRTATNHWIWRSICPIPSCDCAEVNLHFEPVLPGETSSPGHVNVHLGGNIRVEPETIRDRARLEQLWAAYCQRHPRYLERLSHRDTLIKTVGERLVAPAKAEPKVGRNDPCPCGSGKKYKKCCGS